MQNKLSLELLEERMRIEKERMALDVNTEIPFVRQGSGRRPGPRKFLFDIVFIFLFVKDATFSPSVTHTHTYTRPTPELNHLASFCSSFVLSCV